MVIVMLWFDHGLFDRFGIPGGNAPGFPQDRLGFPFGYYSPWTTWPWGYTVWEPPAFGGPYVVDEFWPNALD